MSRDGAVLVTAPRIHTLAGPPVRAMAVRDGRVVLTGDPEEVAAAVPVEEVVSLSGTVLPGFHDAHAHPTMTAENLLHLDCSPGVASDRPRLEQLLRDEADAVGGDGWVIGSRYDHTKSTGGRVLDRWDLDRVVGGHPALLLHVSVHWGVLSSAGLAAAGLDDDSPDPPGGVLGRDAGGRLDGRVYEQALFDVAYPSLARGATVLPTSSLEARLRGLRRALALFHSAGITSMCDALCGPDDVELLAVARERGTLSMRTSALVAYPHYDRLPELRDRVGQEPDRLKVLGVKAFVDGACAGGNCLVDEPFEGTDDHGMQVLGADVLEELVARATQDGVVLGVHANGDRAIRLLLRAHEQARSPGQPVPRHRIEHCTLVDDDIVRRIRALGLVAVPFGSYPLFHGDKLRGYYGEERLERMFAHRTLLDAGVPVAGSSDYPCGPYEPLLALQSCVERRAADGTPVGLSQRIPVGEAVGLYTVGAAYATGSETSRGRLAPGMLADFVELSADPFQTPGEELATLTVRSTWVGGSPVHRAADA